MLVDWNLPFRALVDSAPDGLIVCDAHGQIVVVNGEAERMFGYDHDELIGRSVDALIPERVRPFHHRYVETYTQAPRLRPMGSNLDLRGRHKDGREIPVEIRLSPLTTERGLLIIAAVRDVSDQRRLEHEHRRMAAYLASAVEAVQDAFLLFDENDRVIMMNSAARASLGDVGAAPVIGRSFEDLLAGSLETGFYALGEETPEAFRTRRLAYHHAPTGTFDLRTAQGRHLRIIEHRTAEHGAVTMVTDITDDVRRADELRHARAQAEAASAAKSEFLSSMSHELRTPLNAILGFAQLLERDRKRRLDDHQLERLGYVQRGGEHLLRLIDDVLDLARIEAGRVSMSVEPVNVGDVLGEVVRTLEPMAARTSTVIALAPLVADLPSLHADRTRLVQILMNFGSNAIKYGKPNGHVTFRTALTGASLRIEVSDDGIGIPADKRDRIFEPFQRAGQESGPIQGTGIGLTISKRLAELMHGTVGFASESGHGSQFWLELPIHRRPASAPVPPRVAASAASPLAAGECRHLVVYIEDNPSNIAFMRDLIEELPSVELVTASTAELGLPLIRSRRPNVVIMDINLPGMSGVEAVQRLRAWPETRDIPVIGLSAAALVKDTARAKDAGFYRYLTKPVKVAELTETLEALLEYPPPPPLTS